MKIEECLVGKKIEKVTRDKWRDLTIEFTDGSVLETSATYSIDRCRGEIDSVALDVYFWDENGMDVDLEE